MNKFSEKTIKRETIFEGKIIDLSVHDVELPNGEMSKREIVNHPGAVAVIAVTDKDEVILVEQFRKPLEKTIAEIPAGKLEKGENPLQCAKRELEEETGLVAGKWTKLTSFYTSPGFANEIIYIYLAEQLSDGQLNLDEDEFVECFKATLEEAEKLIEKEIIHDAKTIYAIQYLNLLKYRCKK
ncbi:NUDIX hydrolase [Evansella cellulosilytica]|uniref:NUDIX hydrolase n=1 Tax=Evansella cellulosilytica (strain ATCC 21833 / DSM 2522 / FERM P-1141 / JCM 9156 / N-4) TaxID=649639 RepID=E6TYJ4_EVAC2|nr:NUDIX hydrolase [Evansella cellulosilytica]ADU30044.1 NUDIX hydrolase [Evansella cellulosilytica DSM 2522]